MLKRREYEGKALLANSRNGRNKPAHNITEGVCTRIGNDSPRVAALRSGEIDMMYTVPPQDIERIRKTKGVKIYEGPELRTIFLGFDQVRDELQDSSVKGKNPFKDIRVRKAFYQAIDEEAIKSK